MNTNENGALTRGISHDVSIVDRLYDYIAKLGAENEQLQADRASDQQRLFHYEGEIERMWAQLFDATKLSREWMRKHDYLLGFIQAHPEMLKELIAHDAALAGKEDERGVPAWSRERCRAVNRSNIPETCDWPRCCGEHLAGKEEK